MAKDDDKKPDWLKAREQTDDEAESVRLQFKKQQEEQRLAEIGKEGPNKARYAEDLSESMPRGSKENPEGVTEPRVDISNIQEALDVKAPQKKPTKRELRAAERRARQRTPRGTGGTGIFTFDTTKEVKPDDVSVKQQSDVMRRLGTGLGPSPLSRKVISTGIALATRDWNKANETGKAVNGIEPNSEKPTEMSIRLKHHERVAKLMSAFGVEEKDLEQLPGNLPFVDKVNMVHATMEEHWGSQNKVNLSPNHEKATHWEDPTTGKVQPIAAGGHPQFYKHLGHTILFHRPVGESAWRAVEPVREGWAVRNVSGKKTFVFQGNPRDKHPGSQFINAAQFFHDTLKNPFKPQVASNTDSADSRARARVAASKFINPFGVKGISPASAEGKRISRGKMVDDTLFRGYLQSLGRTRPSFVGSETEGPEVKAVPEDKFVAVSGPTRRPKRPQRYLSRPALGKQFLGDSEDDRKTALIRDVMVREGAAKPQTGPLSAVDKLRAESYVRGKNRSFAKAMGSTKPAKEMVQGELPEIGEFYSPGSPEKVETTSRIEIGGGAPLGAESQPHTFTRVVEQKVTPATPAGPGYRPPVEEKPEVAPETSTRKKYKKTPGGIRNVEPAGYKQEELGFTHQGGRQWVNISPATKKLQEDSEEGGLSGAPIETRRGVAERPSTKSYKKRS